MHLGIIGLPRSGKTTVFNVLTGEDLPVGPLAARGLYDVQTAVVGIPDSRLDALSELLKPRKTTYAKVTFSDIGGLQVGSGREGLPGPLMNQLETMDALLHVVRVFDEPTAPHPLDTIDPARDHMTLETELLLHDMLTVERRLQRLEEERQKGARDRDLIDREIALFEHLTESLDRERPLRTLDLTIEEGQMLSGFSLLTLKPVLVVINLGEGEEDPDLDISDGVQSLSLQGKLEMEIAQLAADEAQAFLAEYGIEQPGRERIIHSCCDLLGFLSFFTFNEQEGRAWTLRQGSSALEAAETIHSDLARGFIKAEAIAWDELVALGGLTEARAQGKLRLEGKDYQVADGELIYIRFSV
ncbi:MAG: redox-regulated ATPase YchF [Anaerolineaceae bacterium]|nr:MAG: redox-regulated ATPase YchF [Anaerolineaceae bacterium]